MHNFIGFSSSIKGMIKGVTPLGTGVFKIQNIFLHDI